MSNLPGASGLVIAVTAPTMNIASAESAVVASPAGQAFDGPPGFDLIIGDATTGPGTSSRTIRAEADVWPLPEATAPPSRSSRQSFAHLSNTYDYA